MIEQIKSMVAEILDFMLFTWVFAGMVVLGALPFMCIGWVVWLLFR